MAVRMSKSSWLQDAKGNVLAGPGEIPAGITAEEEAALVRGGSAEPIESPANPPAEEKEN
jgi:hypothetical protein